MKKIKVLMLVPNLFVANGVASFVMNYLRNLNHDEVQVDIASYKEGDSVYYAEGRGCRVEKMVFFFRVSKTFLSMLKSVIKFCRMVGMTSSMIITLHISIPMMWCAKKAGVPVRILHSLISKMGETPAKAFRNRFFFFQCCVRWRQIMRHVHSWQAVQCSKIKGLR